MAPFSCICHTNISSTVVYPLLNSETVALFEFFHKTAAGGSAEEVKTRLLKIALATLAVVPLRFLTDSRGLDPALEVSGGTGG